MVARATDPDRMVLDLQQGLRSADARTRLGAVKALKNQVIGNRFKKLQYLHLLPQLLELATADENLAVQCLAAVGSLAYGVEEGVRAIAACGGITCILQALSSNNKKVIEAAARSLKLVYQRLVWLAQDPGQSAAVAEAAASTLGHCCASPAEAQQVFTAGAVPALLHLLASPRRSSQEAAVEALAGLTDHSLRACQQLLLLQQPSVAAATLSTDNLRQQDTEQQPSKKHATGTKMQQQQQQQQQEQQQQQYEALETGYATACLHSQQQQQQGSSCYVLEQLLQLAKQRDNRLRFMCARCISNLSRACVVDSAVPLLQPKLLQACRVMLHTLVRLLSVAEAASSSELHLASSHWRGGSLFGSSSSGSSGMRPGSIGSGSSSGSGQLGSEAGCDCRYLLQVPHVLAQLTSERPELLKLAMDLEAIQLLIKLLTSKAATDPDSACSSSAAATTPAATAAAAAAGASSSAFTSAAKARAAAAAAAATEAAAGAAELRRGCLMALGVLSLQGDAARQQMVEARLVPQVVASLSDPDAGVRAAAACCLRGLSRSVRLLRGPAIPPSVVAPLTALLQDCSNSAVQAAAAGAVSNLLLSFSCLRPALLQAGVLPLLTPLTQSMLPDLRLNAVWAFKNLAHECGGETQLALLSQLTWRGLKGLLVEEDDARVQEQAVALLQNLCKGGDSVQQLLEWSDGDLLLLLEQQLNPALYQQLPAATAMATAPAAASSDNVSGSSSGSSGSGSSSSGSSSSGSAAPLQQLKARLVGLLYTTANICSGYESHKQALMKTNIPALLLHHLTAGSSTFDGGRTSTSQGPAAAGGTTCACAGAGSGGGDSTAPAAGPAGPAPAAPAAAGALDSDAFMCDVRLAAVWCVINLLWSEGTAAVAAAAAAAIAGGGGSGSGGGSAVPAVPQDGAGQQQPAPAVASEALQARAAVLRRLGFEAVLKDVLARAYSRASGPEAAAPPAAATPMPPPPPPPGAAEGPAAAAAAAAAGGVGGSGGSATEEAGAAAAAAAVAAAGTAPATVPENMAAAVAAQFQPVMPRLLDAGSQDLTERVQTALEQLRT